MTEGLNGLAIRSLTNIYLSLPLLLSKYQVSHDNYAVNMALRPNQSEK